MPTGPRKVSASLDDAARSFGIEGGNDVAALVHAWASIVGPLVAAHCRPAGVRNGCLTIVTDHSAWGSQLRALEAELLAKARPIAPALTRLIVRVSP